MQRYVAFTLFLAAAARLPWLDHRAMHADEAILADKFGAMLATGKYTYDPAEYHGPVLAYLTWIPAHLSGRITYQALTERTLRITPAIAGILVALSPLLLAPVIGTAAACWASLLVAISPAMIYYSRYFIPEMALALWTVLLLAAIVRRSWAMAGAAAALMIATKETAVLALTAAAIAYLATYRSGGVSYRPIGVLLAGLVTGISVLLAPPWKWGLLAQSAAEYFARGAGGGAHRHPFYSYLQWMSITEAPILILGAIGLASAWRKPSHPAIKFLGLYAAILLAIYSAIPYKTPWCAASALFALCLLAGSAAAAIRGAWRTLLLAGVGCLGVAAWLTNGPYAVSPRNPWAYAHTGPGVYTIRDRLREFARVSPTVTIDIYTTANLWPLPWYLRDFPEVRWWRQVAIPGSAAPIVLVTPELEPDLTRKLYEGPPPGERELYMNLFEDYVELRPQVEVRGYAAKSLWDRVEEAK